MLSISLNVFLPIYIIWRKLSPDAETIEWQGVWRGLGKFLQRWGLAVSLNFTLEHLQKPEIPSKYLSQGCYGLGRSEEAQIIWDMACVYQALYNTILERERVSKMRSKPKGEVSDLNER